MMYILWPYFNYFQSWNRVKRKNTSLFPSRSSGTDVFLFAFQYQKEADLWGVKNITKTLAEKSSFKQKNRRTISEKLVFRSCLA